MLWDKMNNKRPINSICEADITKAWSGQIRISPDGAKYALVFNIGNRRVRKALVDYLATCILSGEWQEDHPQPVVFSDAGRMIDGQHRMLAIIKANVEVIVNVVFGARDELREYVDTGISRTLEDRVDFDPDIRINQFIAAVINAYSWLCMSSSKIGRLTPDLAKSIFNQHKESILFSAHFMKRNIRRVTRAPVACALVIMFERDEKKAKLFAESLCVLDGEVQQARVLRDTLIQGPNGGGQAITVSAYGKSVSAMKAYLDDKPIKILRVQAW